MLPFGTAQGMGLLDFIKEALKSEAVLIQILPSIVTVNWDEKNKRTKKRQQKES